MLGVFNRRRKRKVKHYTILLVDDQPNLLETMQRSFEHRNWAILTASNGKEGLEMAMKEKPDLIVLDIDMPVMNGHEMLIRLRAQSDLVDVPVIMCSMSDHVHDIAQAAAHNVYDYVTKPFNCMELTERIESALVR